MKKIAFLSLLMVVGLNFLTAQNNNVFPRPENNFEWGKELFDQGKYAASYRYFEDYLESKPQQKGELQELEYYMAMASYHIKSADAYSRLLRYIEKHPYSPFSDQVFFTLGKIALDEKDYKLTLEYFSELNEKRLNKQDRTEKTFMQAYALLQMKEYERAALLFKQLNLMNTRYNFSSKYYYAYTQYVLNNFDVALPLFLELEELDEYKDVVAYYIVQLYYNKGEYEKLMERATAILKKDPENPNNVEIYRILGEIAYKNKEYVEAIALLSKYEQNSEQVLRNDLYLLGMSYYLIDEYKKAIEYLSKTTTKSDAMSENAYLHIGNSYVKLKSIPNAKMSFEQALSTNFDKTVREEALYNYALTTYESNAVFGESFAAFERLLDEFPYSKYTDSAYDYLSSLYMRSQNFKKAYESIIKMRGKNKQMIQTKQYLLNQLGAESFAEHNYSKAVEYFTLALQETPNKKYCVESLYWRADSYYQLGLYEEAIKDLENFFSIPESGASPNNKQAYYLMGHAYFSAQNYVNAVRCFKQYTWSDLSPQDPTYAESFCRLGDCYYYFRDFVNAEKEYQKAIRLSPQTRDYPLYQIAYIKGLQKKNREKIELLNQLVSYFPRSQYADDALYEIGRAALTLGDDDKAIASYKTLLNTFPKSEIASKVALEIGLIYLNQKETNKAIDAFKYVIANYPGTEDARTALDSLEPIYIDLNQVPEYLEYAKQQGEAAQRSVVNREDSILFVAAEKLYFKKQYTQAIGAFKEYLETYGMERHFSVLSKYYLANSYYNNKDMDKALEEYDELAKNTNEKYKQEAIMRAAEITYDKKEYKRAEQYFSELYLIASTTETKNIALLGLLRSNYILNNPQKTVDIAKEILDDPNTNESVKQEAYFNRAKAYMALGNTDLAISDFEQLGSNTKTSAGAESKFLLAELYFTKGKLDEAEQTVMSFAAKNTPHQYWLARSFILLADIYVKRNDDFQAKQYLLSLKKNYTDKNDVQSMINTRLEEISLREQKKVIN